VELVENLRNGVARSVKMRIAGRNLIGRFGFLRWDGLTIGTEQERGRTRMALS
jgi:hypothetical protein